MIILRMARHKHGRMTEIKKGDKLHLYRSLSMVDISMKRGHSTIQPDIRRKSSTIQLSIIYQEPRNFGIQIQIS